ncbi:acetylornithine deacetylase/succinyl-diaminopimelate desuccinylase-like protein [Nocardia tenerifensis]|uniref:Acetylornithine deacetylase/succinyl-diaminopimelate desuccinylase-like protein n=1 Tax=Nocardia tenerifensis TaxID=228006 RepID=A0A318KDX5_9NOCA|nr:M20/M25/M40 family metallo-hydrolase [Nocardia tenerifensis]PXX69290.1 acetylornithine deacetylase/succinyl-diaminopimelate desuccinylase-like protein [Nocardia tenerifensis]
MSDFSRRKPLISVAALGLIAALTATACNSEASKNDASSTSSSTSTSVAAQDNTKLFHDIYKQLVETDTSHSTGSTTVAANAVRQRLLDAGFAESDIQIFEPVERKGDLMLRFAGSGRRKPLLLMGHLDVVEAKREDGWTTDPYKLTEADGYYAARGSNDDKAMVSALVSGLIELKREGFKPDRDIVLALTADEEAGKDNGAKWLMDNKFDLMNAEYGLNEGGRALLVDGKPTLLGVQVAEKTYAAYQVEAKAAGGHSSVPTKDNAIYTLTAALNRLAAYRFPTSLSDPTRDNFGALAAGRSGQEADDMRAVAAGTPSPEALERLSANPEYNAQLRTTCVATMLTAGEAENALPQTAKATVNCRILPQDKPDDVDRQLRAALADDKLTITPKVDAAGGISPTNGDVMTAVTTLTKELFPTAAVSSFMSSGATDSKYARSKGIPMYGVSGLFMVPADAGRIHGINERVPIAGLDASREFLYRLIKQLSQ